MNKKIAIIFPLVLGASLHAMERETFLNKEKKIITVQSNLISLIQTIFKNGNKLKEADILKKLNEIMKNSNHSFDLDVYAPVEKSRFYSDKVTLLHAAIKWGLASVTRFALEYSASPNCYNRLGVSPLHIAASNGMYDVVVLLIEAGANIHDVALDGRTVMHCAVTGGCPEIINLLYHRYSKRYGAMAAYQVFSTGDVNGDTPLHILISILGQLRDNKYEEYRFSSLIQVVGMGDVNVQNKRGITPLHMAVEQGLLPLVNELLNRGAEVNVADNDGMTPLHLALCVRERENIIPLLLEAGANSNARNARNLTPSEVAREQNNLEALKAYEREIKMQREREEAANKKYEERKEKEERAVHEAYARTLRLRPVRDVLRPHEHAVHRLQQRLRDFIDQVSPATLIFANKI